MRPFLNIFGKREMNTKTLAEFCFSLDNMPESSLSRSFELRKVFLPLVAISSKQPYNHRKELYESIYNSVCNNVISPSVCTQFVKDRMYLSF